MLNGLKKLLAALFVGCCVVLQSSAAIVSMNPQNGHITWDIKPLIFGTVYVFAYAFTALVVIFAIRAGWLVIRKYLGFDPELIRTKAIAQRLKNEKMSQDEFNKLYKEGLAAGLTSKRAYRFAASNQRSYNNHKTTVSVGFGRRGIYQPYGEDNYYGGSGRRSRSRRGQW